MKKFLILTACFSMVFAEDPVITPPAAATTPIESQNSPIQAAQPLKETETQKIQVSSPALPATTPPDAVMKTQAVELSTESPAVQVAPTQAAKGVQGALPAPTIVEQTSLDLED